MERKYCYEYPRPAVTTDCLIFSKQELRWFVLLIQRANVPYKGFWALPGGFLEMNETLEDCAHRELQEETGLRDIHLRQFKTYSGLNRDPRGRVISCMFYGFANMNELKPQAADDAKEVAWYPVDDLPGMAFDHIDVIQEAFNFIEKP